MSISGVADSTNFLAQQATAMQGSKAQQQIGFAVLKEVLDQQQAAGESIIKLIQSASEQFASTGHVDISA